MQEIEAKFYVSDLNRMRSRLRKARARLVQRRMYEANIRFDTPDASLRREGRVLRIRRDNQARMTYKGPGRKESGVLSRIEIEFVVEDFQSAKLFLESLGYEKLVFYEKYRATFKLGKTHVMLDELPYGSFVEIEGPDKKSIRAAADKLGLNWEAALETSYHALFDRFCRKRKLKIRDLSFKNFRKMKVGPEDLSVTPAD